MQDFLGQCTLKKKNYLWIWFSVCDCPQTMRQVWKKPTNVIIRRNIQNLQWSVNLKIYNPLILAVASSHFPADIYRVYKKKKGVHKPTTIYFKIDKNKPLELVQGIQI